MVKHLYIPPSSTWHKVRILYTSCLLLICVDFVGSNNIPLLFPSGQFGTRLQGGKDAASARYIFTRLNTLTRMIFPEGMICTNLTCSLTIVDDDILDYNIEENQVIEPKHYLPIIPTVLVNGCEGMGTGWSTLIPSFDPIDVIDNLLAIMEGKVCFYDNTFTNYCKNMKQMSMWVRGFTGTIIPDGSRFITSGKATRKGKSVVIDELPVGKWTDDYKEWLIENGYKITEHHTDTQVK